MASNYVQLNWLDPAWDDDGAGALTSLERRQRKAAERADVTAFYSSLGFLFFVITGLLIWSEIYAFATAPSRALTGAFLLEVYRGFGMAYAQLRNLYAHVGHLAWTLSAITYGPDFATRGVSVTHGAAKLLARGLYYLAVALSGMVMYRIYPYVAVAPLRATGLITMASGVLLGAPPLYAVVTSYFCRTCSPEPVVLLAMLFGAIMCFAALRMARGILGRLADGGPQCTAAKQRGAGAPPARRPPSAAPAAGGGGGPAATTAPSGVGGGGGLGWPGGLKRGSAGPNRGATASGRSSAAVSLSGEAAQIPAARTGAASSSYNPVAAPSCVPGPGGGGNNTSGRSSDPVIGVQASARGANGVARAPAGGSGAHDPTAPLPNAKSGAPPGGTKSGSAASTNSGGGTATSLDPVAAPRSSTAARGTSTSASAGNGPGTAPSSAAASKGSGNANNVAPSKSQRSASGTSGDGGGGGTTKASKQSAASSAGPSAASASRSVADPTAPGKQTSTQPSAKPSTPPDPVASPAAGKKKAAAGANAPAAGTSAAPAANTAASSASGSARHSASSIPAGGGGGTGAASTASAPSKSRADSGGASKLNPVAASAATGASAKAATSASAAPAAAPSSAAAAAAPAATAASGSGSGLLARLTASVSSATAAAAPVLSGRAAKKAASAARKQQQAVQPQYIIVPPPPPRKPAAATAPAVAATTTTAAPSASQGEPQPVRNAWLNPNPVIKQAVQGKGTRGAAPGAASPPAAAVPASNVSMAVVPPPPPPPPRPAVPAASTGISSADPPHSPLSSRSSGGYSSICTDPVAPPPQGAVAGAAIGEPVVSSRGPIAPLLSQQQPARPSGGGVNAVGAIDGLVSATIVTTDASFGPLVAHKHASGDLDISSAAANYRPYPSALPPLAAPPPIGSGIADPESESFSFFSIPPPGISDASLPDAIGGGAADIDAAPTAQTTAQELYSLYGPGGGYSTLTSFAADPVWNPNLPALFSPTAAGPGGGRGPRVPPPGFPSHAYGGAFASFASGVWAQHPPAAPAPLPTAADAAAAAVASVGNAADALPLPPAGENGVLASLGFVDDSAADGSSAGGGEDGAGSCAICWSAPRQVGFLHGKTSHLCVCRRCAAQLREGVHRCPMCRQLIERIIDIF